MKNLKQLFIATLIAFASISAPSFAKEEPLQDDMSKLNQCIEEEGGGYYAMTCFGSILGECLDDKTSNPDMMKCAVEEFMVWDMRLKTTYSAILDKASARVTDSLKLAQNSWGAFLNDACSANALVYEGGTQASLAMAICMADQTAVRSLQLDQFLMEVDMH